MDKYIYDEKNGLWYELQGDYYLPCLKLPKEESRHMGTATLAVSETAPQGTLFRTADKRQAERLPCRPKRAGRGNVLSLVKQLAEAAAKRRKQDEKTNFEHYAHPVYGAEHRPHGGFCGGRGQHKHRQSH